MCLFTVPHQREHVAAVPAEVRGDDPEGEVGSDHGVERVAAVGEDGVPGRGGEVVR